MKLTDEEIKKALECCIEVKKDCYGCSLQNKWNCDNALIQNALDLINRQKAEIESLKNSLHEYIDKEDISELKMYELLAKTKSEAYKECLKKFEKNIKDVKFTLGQTWEIQNALKETLKEMVGEIGNIHDNSELLKGGVECGKLESF